MTINNRWVWNLSTLLTLLGLIASIAIPLAIWQWQTSDAEKALTVQLKSSISYTNSLPDDFEISVDNMKVTKPYTVTYIIKNTGNQAIIPSDFIQKLTFTLNKGQIVKYESYSPQDISVEFTQQKNTLTMKPLLLNSQDELFIQITTIETEPNFAISARIVNIPTISFVNLTKENDSMLKQVLSGFSGIVSILLYAKFMFSGVLVKSTIMNKVYNFIFAFSCLISGIFSVQALFDKLYTVIILICILIPYSIYLCYKPSYFLSVPRKR